MIIKMNDRSPFSKKVIQLIQAIPKGKIATYGQIAKLAGKPQGSRGVSWILHSSSKAHNLPWQRVLNSKGMISFPMDSAEFKRQKQLLVKEGIDFNEADQIDLKKFQWRRKPAAKKPAKNKPKLFSS